MGESNLAEEKIPDEDHVVRFYGKSYSLSNGLPAPTAFHLKDKDIQQKADETYLSVNWIEFLKKNSVTEAIAELRTVFKNKMNSVGTHARFGMFNMGNARETVSRTTDFPGVIFGQRKPEPQDESHSGIFGVTEDNHKVAAVALAKCVQEIFSAKV